MRGKSREISHGAGGFQSRFMGQRQFDKERGPHAFGRFEPDSAGMPVDDSFQQGKTYAFA